MFRQVLAIACILALTGCKTTDEAMQERGIAPLGPAEVRATLADATTTSGGDGWSIDVFHTTDGTMRGAMTADGGRTAGAGSWSVDEAGLYCRDWDNEWGGGGLGCFAIYRDTGDYLMVHRTGSASRIREFRFTVAPGNPGNL